MTEQQRRAALKSYEAGWKRSRAFWAKEWERREAENAARWAREREIIAAEFIRATKWTGQG